MYPSYYSLVKCKLTVTQNSNDSTGSSILKTQNLWVLSLTLSHSSQVVWVSSQGVWVSSPVIQGLSRGDNKFITQLIFPNTLYCICQTCWFTFGDRETFEFLPLKITSFLRLCWCWVWTHFLWFRATFHPFAGDFRVTFSVSFQFDVGFCFYGLIEVRNS